MGIFRFSGCAIGWRVVPVTEMKKTGGRTDLARGDGGIEKSVLDRLI